MSRSRVLLATKPTLFPLAVLICRSWLCAEAPDCLRAQLEGREDEWIKDFIVVTSDYAVELGSASGAVGDVVAVPVIFSSQLVNPGSISLSLAICHDPAVAELFTLPRYSPEIIDLALTVQATPIDEDNPNQPNPVGHGIFVDINFLQAGYNSRFPSPEPLLICTLYYRLKGVPGNVGQVALCDGVLMRGNARCLYSHMHGYNGSRPQGWEFFSATNVNSSLTVLEGPATHPDPPPEPVTAKIYEELPSNEAINFRVRVEAGAASPGATSVPVELYAAADIEYSGILLTVDFDERYLRLTGVQRHVQPGSNLIDNRDDADGSNATEGHGIITNLFGISSYRLAAAGEEVHVATLAFEVLPSAAAISETRLEVQPVTDHRGLVYKPFLALSHRQGLGVAEPPITSEVEPIAIQHGLLKIVMASDEFLRGDANADSALDISDAVFTLSYLFSGGARPFCPDAADANDDGVIDISDPTATLNFLFLTGKPLPPPSGVAGLDPTPDVLGECFGFEV